MRIENNKLIIESASDNGTYKYTGVDSVSKKETTLEFKVEIPESDETDSEEPAQ